MISKDKEIEDFKNKSKLTKEQREALRFFEDKYLQSQSLKQIISNNYREALNSTDETTKLIVTNPHKITESGATEVSKQEMSYLFLQYRY